MTIQDILDAKNNHIIAIEPHHTLHQAFNMLVEKKVGALIVQDINATLGGIITERDLMREIYKGTDLQQTQIKNVMTSKLVTSSPDQDVSFAMIAMTEGHFRHLPVIKKDTVIGIVSIGDLVKSQLHQAEEEVIQYKNFMALDCRAS